MMVFNKIRKILNVWVLVVYLTCGLRPRCRCWLKFRSLLNSSSGNYDLHYFHVPRIEEKKNRCDSFSVIVGDVVVGGLSSNICVSSFL